MYTHQSTEIISGKKKKSGCGGGWGGGGDSGVVNLLAPKVAGLEQIVLQSSSKSCGWLNMSNFEAGTENSRQIK